VELRAGGRPAWPTSFGSRDSPPPRRNDDGAGAPSPTPPPRRLSLLLALRRLGQRAARGRLRLRRRPTVAQDGRGRLRGLGARLVLRSHDVSFLPSISSGVNPRERASCGLPHPCCPSSRTASRIDAPRPVRGALLSDLLLDDLQPCKQRPRRAHEIRPGSLCQALTSLSRHVCHNMSACRLQLGTRCRKQVCRRGSLWAGTSPTPSGLARRQMRRGSTRSAVRAAARERQALVLRAAVQDAAGRPVARPRRSLPSASSTRVPSQRQTVRGCSCGCSWTDYSFVRACSPGFADRQSACSAAIFAR
jgi:hypothetical protein